jgi:Icc-related predicted phosphoesterase
MLFRPFSDLHVEFWLPHKVADILKLVVPPLPTDQKTVAVIAGDLGLAHRQETWLKALGVFSRRFLSVVYVEGNHFFYHNDSFGRIHELKSKLSLPKNVHFLENESVEINEVVFIGATLWTDFNGKDISAMQLAKRNINDYVSIKKTTGGRLLPEDTVELFYESKKFIFDAIGKASDKKTVVVTHHGVSPLSVPERYRGDNLNYAFMSDLSDEVTDHGPDIWVHGHTHDSFDYMLGETRVLVNPYGYKDVALNPLYDKNLIIEL